MTYPLVYNISKNIAILYIYRARPVPPPPAVLQGGGPAVLQGGKGGGSPEIYIKINKNIDDKT